ncbi:rust resistance kinase Lr10-like [Musa acuminata AAA Group]|uniref:rust resistance kinase Lr10-like n=1 Tax=Musa acuminata AAA Group TaxID=214697 RepID=UPI0031DF2127
MNRLLCTLFLLFVHASDKKTWGNKEEDDFLKDCRTTRCGGITVRYPFRLKSSPPYCGVQGLELSCSGGDAILSLPPLGLCTVISINYYYGEIRIKLGESWSPCPLQKLSSIDLTSSPFYEAYLQALSFVNCSGKFTPDPAWITGPIPCLGNGSHNVYAADSSESMGDLPSVCMVTSSSDGWIPYDSGSWEEKVQKFIRTREMNLQISVPETSICRECEEARKPCGFNRTGNQTYCITRHHGPNIKIIIVGTCTAGFVLVLLPALILFYVRRKSTKEEETRLKVENFLATYGDAKPTRYTFADVKKITRRFKDRLGQGGYGSVYKGELPNGIPVAVKMLERSKGEGEEFINEVATIGRIHHVNIVRLLGFCSERSSRALIYEFMPNESLEKYIFSREASGADKPPLNMEKLLNIAIRVARGIEYLHQGCQQRILHFDIKPHNVLLDHEFNPKISDFGLAKLCSREQSIVTMTAARGTMGYIAPEMYSRNFGTVSYKSDVYSFGMLVLEMVGGRKNHDPEIGKQNEIYFPEWVYDRLVHRQDLGLAMEMEGEEEEIVKKLAIVALWCIQWSPIDRPSMTRVLQMLTGTLQSLQMPPKPFVSSLDHV